MTGYQEILTDPSYRGQIVSLTASHIGVTGTNQDDSLTATITRYVALRTWVFARSQRKPPRPAPLVAPRTEG